MSVEQLVDFYVTSLESQGFTPTVSDLGGDSSLQAVSAQLLATDERPAGSLSITISDGGTWLEEGESSIAANFRSSSFDATDLLEGPAANLWIESAETLLALPEGATLVRARTGDSGALTSSYRIGSTQSIDEVFADLHSQAQQDGFEVGGSPDEGGFFASDGNSLGVFYEKVFDEPYFQVTVGG